MKIRFAVPRGATSCVIHINGESDVSVEWRYPEAATVTMRASAMDGRGGGNTPEPETYVLVDTVKP